MASSQYIQSRWKLSGLRKRPQAVAFADGYVELQNGLLVPSGVEYEDFIILSDHNRLPIDITKQRIENRQRLNTGYMRSYHVADKQTVSLSWQDLPSRAFSGEPTFDQETGFLNLSGLTVHTVDSGAGGVDMVKWYEDHPGSFYMFLAYDRYDRFGSSRYERMGQYNEVIEVMFTSFENSVSKRGGSTYDFWDVSMTLEEV